MNLNFEEPEEIYPITNWDVPNNAEEEFAKAINAGNFTYAKELRAYNLDYNSFEMSHLLVTLALNNKPVSLLFLLEGAPSSYVTLLESEFIDLCIMRRADVLEIILGKNVGRDQCLKGLIECLINNNNTGPDTEDTLRTLLNYINPNTDVPNEYLGPLINHNPPFKLLTALAYLEVPLRFPAVFKELISKGADYKAVNGQLYREFIDKGYSLTVGTVLNLIKDRSFNQEAFDYYMSTIQKNDGTSWLETFSGIPVTVSEEHLKNVYNNSRIRSWFWSEDFLNNLGQHMSSNVKNYGLDLVKNDPKNDIFKNIFLREMLEMGADPNYDDGELLRHFVNKADITNVKELLNNGAIVPEDILKTSGDSSVNILLRRSYDMQQKLKKRIQEQLDRTYYPNES